jgi:hypothetical protein
MKLLRRPALRVSDVEAFRRCWQLPGPMGFDTGKDGGRTGIAIGAKFVDEPSRGEAAAARENVAGMSW